MRMDTITYWSVMSMGTITDWFKLTKVALTKKVGLVFGPYEKTVKKITDPVSVAGKLKNG